MPFRRLPDQTNLPWVLVAPALLATLTVGCASEALLRTDHLPVERVVVYRNGVAYFERGGRVDGSEVRFKMKEAEVGDFLATLAVMEKDGSSVRAAAFPLASPDEPGDESQSLSRAELERRVLAHEPKAPQAPQQQADALDQKRGLRTVVLSLDGKHHDLQVGYVAASPVWRPSYRLVVHADGAADLQAWGIVQNLSGEDWKGVRLALVAGSPLAFETDLGTTVVPTRPLVTDNGEVVAVVPHGETSLLQEPTPAPVAQAAPVQAVPTPREAAKTKAVARHEMRPRSKGALDKDDPGPPGGALSDAGAAPPPPPSPDVSAFARPAVSPSGPRDIRSLAAIAAEGGTTRYDLPNPVTIPDRSATMVLLLSRPVPGEALFLFAPEGGVGDSSSHPFRVARFANKSGGVLERGPIAVFEDGSFLGQGLVDPLPDGATATVPFALERSIAVDLDRSYDELGERVGKIENLELTVERDQVRKTKYRVRNGGEKAVKMLIKHPREAGARLFSPPKDTDDNVGTGSALVPLVVLPHATTEIVVEERTPVRRQVDWFSALAGNAVAELLSDPKTSREVVPKLEAAWKVRAEIVEKLDALSKVTAAEKALGESVEETRKNLRAIERNRVAEALRATLTQRLAEAALRLDGLTKQKVEVESKLAEEKIRFRDSLRDLYYVSAPPS